MNKIKYTTALLLGGLLSFHPVPTTLPTSTVPTELIQKNYRNTITRPTSYLSPPFKGYHLPDRSGRYGLAIPSHTELSGGHVLRILPRHERFVQCQQLHL